MQERGFDIGKLYKGEVSMAAKDQGKDCTVGTQDLSGKVGRMLSQHLHVLMTAVLLSNIPGAVPAQFMQPSM